MLIFARIKLVARVLACAPAIARIKWRRLLILSFTNKMMTLPRGDPASSTTAEMYMQAYEHTAITTSMHPPKVWERFIDDVNSILKRTHLENFSHHINNLHQHIKFTMDEESNGELAFLDTLLEGNSGEISVLVYRKPIHIGQCLHYSSHYQTSCQERAVSSLFTRTCSIITNKDDLLYKDTYLCKEILE